MICWPPFGHRIPSFATGRHRRTTTSLWAQYINLSVNYAKLQRMPQPSVNDSGSIKVGGVCNLSETGIMRCRHKYRLSSPGLWGGKEGLEGELPVSGMTREFIAPGSSFRGSVIPSPRKLQPRILFIFRPTLLLNCRKRVCVCSFPSCILRGLNNGYVGILL